MPTVLLVDDHELTLQFVRAAIRDLPDWSTTVLQDGRQAVDLVRKDPARFDIVLLDIFLPGLDGRTVYRHLRDLPHVPEIIAMSGDAEALNEIASAGCRYVLHKPATRHELRDMLQRAMRLHIPPAVPLPIQPIHDYPFERHLIAGADILDLDGSAVERHILDAQTRRGYDGPVDVIEFLLSHHGIAYDAEGVLRPTYAGMLMFGLHPEQYLTGCGVDIGQFHHDTPEPNHVGYRKQIYGSLGDVIERSHEILWALIGHRAHLEHELERVEHHQYPSKVLRELTINALCHRDWSLTSASVQIKVAPTFIEWITPGGLPHGVDVDHLREARVPRNVALATFLYQAGYIEQFGIGMDMVYEQLERRRLVAPLARNQGGWFSFRVYHQTVGQSVIRDPVDTLSERQRRIINLLIHHEPMLLTEISTELKDVPRRSIQRELAKLLELNLITSHGQTRNCRYCLTIRTPNT